jgi:hypothetical protein
LLALELRVTALERGVEKVEGAATVADHDLIKEFFVKMTHKLTFYLIFVSLIRLNFV